MKRRITDDDMRPLVPVYDAVYAELTRHRIGEPPADVAAAITVRVAMTLGQLLLPGTEETEQHQHHDHDDQDDHPVRHDAHLRHDPSHGA